MSGYQIDPRQLMVELSKVDYALKREADREIQRNFDNAVERLQEDFKESKVTQEIAGGADADNISDTLGEKFRSDEGDSKPNLYSFIGFDKSPEDVLKPIRDRLDPADDHGPKLEYQGRDKDKLVYRYLVKAPDEEVIHADTSIPWLEGISWVKRIEQGISGLGHFLNVSGRGRSGGGVQVEGTLRGGRFKPKTYLSKMLNNFLRRVAGRSDNGRSV